MGVMLVNVSEAKAQQDMIHTALRKRLFPMVERQFQNNVFYT